MKIKLLLATAIAALSLASAPAHAAVALQCVHGSGDVVAHPIVMNKTRATIPAGTKITYRVYRKYSNGKLGFEQNSHTLASALPPGKQVQMPKYFPWNFTCTATANV